MKRRFVPVWVAHLFPRYFMTPFERAMFTCNVCHRPGGWRHAILWFIGQCKEKEQK